MEKIKPKKRAAKVPPVPKTPVWAITPEQQIVGAVFLGKVDSVAAKPRVIKLVIEAPVAVGETIRIKGQATDLTQRVEYMRIKGQSVQSAAAGENVVIEVADTVRVGDAVYKH